MAKTLNSISLDSPASPVSAAVNDTFSFAGTPGFSGTGGVNRYDFKWEVNSGGGYVTIAASGTGLITSDTNPVTNQNSAGQQAITVTCNQAGSYTVRMAGAPVTTGAYTVFSATQTVTVSAAAQQGSGSFAGVGNLAATPRLLMRTAPTTFSGAGALFVDLAKPALVGSANFLATGSLVVDTIHFSAGLYDETGAGNVSLSANAFTELEFGLKLDYDNLTTGDVLNFRVYKDGSPLDSYLVTPSLTVPAHAIAATAALAATGALAVDSSLVRAALQGAALMAGASNFDIVPRLRMLVQGTFIGAGLMVVDLAKLAQVWQGAATFSGSGVLAATARLRLVTSAAFAGMGAASFTGASIRIVVGRPPGEISDILQGAGNFVATAKLLAQTRATFAGIGSFSITPQEWMAARASFAGAGSMVADLAKLAAYLLGEAAFIGAGNFLASSKFLLAGRADFSGVGSYSAASQMQLSPTAGYAGAGSFSARVTQQLMAGYANFSGAGSLVVNILQLGKIFETAAFSGVGALVANTRQRMVVTAAYAGIGLASITPRLIMRTATTRYVGAGSANIQPSLIIRAGARATFGGVGNQSALASILYNLSAKYAGVGNMVTAPRLTMDAGDLPFAGVGSFIATAKQRMMVTGIFGAEGNLDISPALRMRGFAGYSGEGSMVADLTPPIMAWTGQATFAGDGALSAFGAFNLPTAASMDAVGNLSVDAIRFINLSEQFFAGTGSFIVGDIQHILAGFINYGGVGYLSVQTTISSARAEWLVCASIGFKPELDAALGISPELPASLALNPSLDGKPNMKAC